MLRLIQAAVVLVVVLLCICASWHTVCAQHKIGSHIGVVMPVYDSGTASLPFGQVLGFPLGISIKPNSLFTYDLEIIPFASYPRIGQVSVPSFNFWIHPGIIYNAGAVNLGLRGAWEAVGVVGFTPLVNKGFTINTTTSLFAELMLPVRFGVDSRGRPTSVVGAALHVGIGF